MQQINIKTWTNIGRVAECDSRRAPSYHESWEGQRSVLYVSEDYTVFNAD